MNTNAKILNEMPAIRIQQYIKELCTMTKLDYSRYERLVQYSHINYCNALYYSLKERSQDHIN